jgi:long-chain acyl-CoA synthetase
MQDTATPLAADILSTLPPRISDVGQRWAKDTPDRLAVVEAAGSLSYGQLAARVAETRKWLVELGLRPGDRIMTVCENCRSFVVVLLASAGLDAWPVLVNARLSAPEIDQIRSHCGPRLTIYAGGTQTVQHAKRHGASFEERPGIGSVAVAAVSEDATCEPLDDDISGRVAALIYTSGTTGLPKGVMLTHRGLLFVAATSAKIRSLAPEDRVYGILPMSHAVGLSVVLLGALLSGSTVYLAQRFDPVAMLAALERDKLTIVLGAPSMFSMLIEYAEMKGFKQLKFPALRIISSSSAPLQLGVKVAVESALGLALHNGYGVTECSPNIAQTLVQSPRADLSVGRILPGMEAKLMGMDGNDVSDGEIGELWVRGPNVMKGYYRAPEETAAAINPEGWFNTRDLARFEDGHLFIAGRTKELIVRFGLNVYPSEVEGVLNTHPSVVRSAVVGRRVDGTQGGEEVIAYVQAAAALSPADIANYAAKHLASYKRPSEILLVSSMPLTPTGKVIKDELVRTSGVRG